MSQDVQNVYNQMRRSLALLRKDIDSSVNRPAFQVIERATGKRFAIYEDGTTEGFDEDCIILNRIPAIKANARLEALSECFRADDE